MWILLLGAVLRLGLWLWFQDRPIEVWDEKDYNTLAVGLVERGEFSLVPGQSMSPRPPLYPTAVAGVYLLCGVENYQAVRFLQACLSLLNVVLLYRLGSEVYSRRAGLWLAGLYCFYPSLLAYNNLLLTEVLFTFLLCAGCYLLIHALQRQQLRWLPATGVVLGLAALTRSVLWLFPPVLGVFLLFAWRGSLRQRVLAAILQLAAFAVTLAPWAIRTTRVEETFIPIDTMGGRNFMMGNYRHTPLYRSWDAISLEGEESWHHEVHAQHPPSERRTQGQLDKLALRHGIQFVLANPGLTLKRDLVKCAQFWGLERELVAGAAQGYFGKTSGPALIALTLVICGGYAGAMLLGVFGAVQTPPSDRRIQWFLLLVIAFVCGIHTVTFGHSRYHLPVVPLILVFAATACAHARLIWQRGRRRSLWIAVGLSLVFVGVWLWEILVVEGDRFLTMLHSLA